MELTKNEKKLLEAIIEAWQQEGHPNVYAWGWGIDERKDSNSFKATTKEEEELGNKLIREAAKSLEKKLKIKIY